MNKYIYITIIFITYILYFNEYLRVPAKLLANQISYKLAYHSDILSAYDKRQDKINI